MLYQKQIVKRRQHYLSMNEARKLLCSKFSDAQNPRKAMAPPMPNPNPNLVEVTWPPHRAAFREEAISLLLEKLHGYGEAKMKDRRVV